MSPTLVSSLEPTAVFRHFDALLAIPRPSKREQAAREYVLAIAARHGLTHREDLRGNISIDLPATPGREGAEVVVLQSHLDMVTVKEPEVEFDFNRDHIVPRRDGEWLGAVGTTLGADNGIGVATMLAWIDDPPGPHGPLELLFTVDEETGLQGVMDLDGGIVRGRRLINLDSEDEGEITIGCAGARGSRVLAPIHRLPAPAGGTFLEVGVRGLVGGHSGMDVAKGRGNAIGLLARVLAAAAGGSESLRLVSLAGGQSHNAIPREATATLWLTDEELESFQRRWVEQAEVVKGEYEVTDPAAEWSVGPLAAAPQVDPLDRASSVRFLDLLLAVPYGVLAMSRTLPGLVETSTNLARVSLEAETGELFLASRSSVDAALTAFCRRVRGLARLAGGEVEETRGYPGWAPNPKSVLLGQTIEVLRAALGREPKVGAVHAGLECGVIGAKCPGMDMVSIGPDIENPHSPSERVHIESVRRFHGALAELLERLGR